LLLSPQKTSVTFDPLTLFFIGIVNTICKKNVT
jgi:hypothetical protein